MSVRRCFIHSRAECTLEKACFISLCVSLRMDLSSVYYLVKNTSSHEEGGNGNARLIYLPGQLLRLLSRCGLLLLHLLLVVENRVFLLQRFGATRNRKEKASHSGFNVMDRFQNLVDPPMQSLFMKVHNNQNGRITLKTLAIHNAQILSVYLHNTVRKNCRARFNPLCLAHVHLSSAVLQHTVHHLPCQPHPFFLIGFCACIE